MHLNCIPNERLGLVGWIIKQDWHELVQFSQGFLDSCRKPSDSNSSSYWQTMNDTIPIATMAHLERGNRCIVHAVHAPEHAPEWRQWLEEIGFIAGEQVTMMAKGLPGGDPLVVRVGTSTFALRRAEAACVRVILLSDETSR